MTVKILELFFGDVIHVLFEIILETVSRYLEPHRSVNTGEYLYMKWGLHASLMAIFPVNLQDDWCMFCVATGQMLFRCRITHGPNHSFILQHSFYVGH